MAVVCARWLASDVRWTLCVSRSGTGDGGGFLCGRRRGQLLQQALPAAGTAAVAALLLAIDRSTADGSCRRRRPRAAGPEQSGRPARSAARWVVCSSIFRTLPRDTVRKRGMNPR